MHSESGKLKINVESLRVKSFDTMPSSLPVEEEVRGLCPETNCFNTEPPLNTTDICYGTGSNCEGDSSVRNTVYYPNPGVCPMSHWTMHNCGGFCDWDSYY
jgi:hypothetical protein